MSGRLIDLVAVLLIANGVAIMHVTGDWTGLLPVVLGAMLYGNFAGRNKP